MGIHCISIGASKITGTLGNVKVKKISGSGGFVNFWRNRQFFRQSVGHGPARAVGNAMARNPLPLVIPCHRVVAGNGKLGGFSAEQGVRLKERLLAMEAASLALSS